MGKGIIKKDKEISIKKLLTRAIVVYISIITTEYLILQILQNFCGNTFFFNNLPVTHKFILFFMISFFCELIYLTTYIWMKYIELREKMQFVQKDELTNDSLVLILENAYNAQRWKEVVKIGRQLSEPLWYTGKFLVRVKIGEFVESAAGLCEEYEIQSETLLDDLGWTKIRLNEIQDAQKNIERGLGIAKEHNYPYLVAKGYRHLADIHLSNACNGWTLRYMDWGNKHLPNVITKTDELEKCKRCYDMALSYLSQIPNIKKRTEMEGNLQYTFAKYCLIKKEYDLALEVVNKSQELYMQNNDYDREVKLFNLKGKILMALDRENEAISVYQEGLRKATTISNNVHMVSNSISLAEYYLKERRINLADKMLAVATENAYSINDPILSERIVELTELVEIKRRSNNE